MSTITTPVTITAEELLEEIKQDTWRLRHIWTTFRFLYAGEKKNVDVLNATAAGFFSMTQRLMFDDVILKICRLTDPAKNRQQENLTLKRLVEATEWQTTDPARYDAYTAKAAAVDTACTSCREHRNKRISHRDVGLFKQMFKLPDATLRMIDDAIAAIEEFVRDINVELRHGDIVFDVIGGEEWGEELMRKLSNRASQKSEETSIILYNAGDRLAEFHCGYCGGKQQIPFYPNGEPPPARMARWHFSTCPGVVGCEESIAVETVERNRQESPRRFTVDLRIPLNETH